MSATYGSGKLATQHCRLLYVVGQLSPGGLERQLCTLLESLDRERYRPEVVVWNFCEQHTHVRELRDLGVTLRFFPGTACGITKLIAFRRLVRQLDPEVVHSYSFYTNFAAYWATRGTRTIPIGSVRSDFYWSMKENGWWLGRLSGRWPRHQICNSFSGTQTSRFSRTPFVPRELFVVRNGLNLESFRPVPPADTGRVCIVGVGSLLPVKRWDRLLKATSMLKCNGFDYLVRIAGDGPIRSWLEQQAQSLGVGDRVEFMGYRINIPDILARAAFLVHTSEVEGCPNAVMEAMACGRAVLATDAGDVPQLVENGRTGFVVRRGDDGALVERMQTLITNRDLRQKMGQAGRAKAEREFGSDRLVSETLAAYERAGWRGC